MWRELGVVLTDVVSWNARLEITGILPAPGRDLWILWNEVWCRCG